MHGPPSSARTHVAIASPCEQVVDWVAVAGERPLPTSLDEHVETCVHCLELMRDALDLGDAIANLADEYEHPTDFASRVMAALDP